MSDSNAARLLAAACTVSHRDMYDESSPRVRGSILKGPALCLHSCLVLEVQQTPRLYWHHN